PKPSDIDLQIDFEIPNTPKIDEITEADLSPKLHILFRVLEERSKAAKESGSVFRAMIFVEKRTTSKILCELINNFAPIKFPTIICSFVTGHGEARSLSGKMNSQVQKNVFDQFRRGEVNTMVVTRVAEEGVDIPACRLVIIFDLFRTHTGYVQSRGRARDVSGSEYIVMVMRDDFAALEHLAQAKVAEMLVRNAAKEISQESQSSTSMPLIEQKIFRGDFDNDMVGLLVGKDDTPLVSIIGAKVTTLSAKTLLIRCCQIRANDEEEMDLPSRPIELQLPTFEFILDPQKSTYVDHKLYIELRRKQVSLFSRLKNIVDGGSTSQFQETPENYSVVTHGFAVKITFPNEIFFSETFPLKYFVGPVRFTPKLATQSASLAVCRFLYSIGFLNEHLLPTKLRKIKPGGFSFRRILNISLNEAREKKDKKEIRSLNFLSHNNSKMSGENTLADYKMTVPNALSLKSWEGLIDQNEVNGDGIGSRILNKPITLHPDIKEETHDLYLTVISFGPQLEVFTRSKDPPISATHNLCNPPYFPQKYPSLANHYYHFPNLNHFALFSGEPRRTFAIITREPISSECMPPFIIWLAGETPCKVELIPLGLTRSQSRSKSPFSKDSSPKVVVKEEEFDDAFPTAATESESSFQEVHPVSFTTPELEKMKIFQKKFWTDILRTSSNDQPTITALQALLKQQNLSTEFESTNILNPDTGGTEKTKEVKDDENLEPDPRIYLLAPLIGSPCAPTQDTRNKHLFSEIEPRLPDVISPVSAGPPKKQNSEIGIGSSSLKKGIDGMKWPKIDDLLDPAHCAWEIDWRLIDRVVNVPRLSLYQWVRGIAEKAESLMNDGERMEKRVKMEEELDYSELVTLNENWEGSESDKSSISTENRSTFESDKEFGSDDETETTMRRVFKLGRFNQSKWIKEINTSQVDVLTSTSKGKRRRSQIDTISNPTGSFDITYEEIIKTQFSKKDDDDPTVHYSKQVVEKINEVLEQTVVKTTHNNVKYHLTQLISSITVDSEFELSRFKSTGLQDNKMTHKKYVEALGYNISHPKSATVEGYQPSGVRNVLRPIQIHKINSSDHSNTRKSKRLVTLVPEVCQLLPYPKEIFQLGLIFPSILHKVETLLHINEFKARMVLPQVSQKTLVAAFTAPSAHEAEDYERLETLGDSFLKYAVTCDLFKCHQTTREGLLSIRRSKIVCNKNLFRKCVSNGFDGIMNVGSFISRNWAPSGWIPKRDAKDNDDFDDEGWDFFKSKGNRWRVISQKMLADFVEALIGGCYVDGGNDVAMKFLYQLDLVSEKMLSDVLDPGDELEVKQWKANYDVDRNDSKDNTDLKSEKISDDEDEIAKDDNLSEESFNNQRAVSMINLYHQNSQESRGSFFNIEEIERKLKYRFHDKRLLFEAFTHISCVTLTTRSYERLEFLGDAVLDWVLTRFFFNSYPTLLPGQLSELRQAAVNNESFSRLSVDLGFHKFLFCDSPQLNMEVSEYLNYLDQEKKQREAELTKMLSGNDEEYSTNQSLVHEGPKVLGDLFEAVAGAVLVDSGWSVSIMWRVFKSLMWEFLEIHVNPEIVMKSPVRQWHEYFQNIGFAVNDISFT
ncbi:hypothetical protein HK096_010914, partial [Nowakowskiella sp. JEL0078]